ncbi:KpsF/GutQ family sugar-phosphate isomerase [Pantoea ananatis]|uniref:KpsF/GutQ family sugar-phosphate isomerase n=1 Tax=Pantoea ananas TaxID=553 RepID=UPI000CF5350F|nr:KpsF/GutQ family sugar-phosphate isomerase [Pantoea ananatis]PQL07085.1 arabinose 5-phosphate isomerase GutQ [Pantoea ananatis]
MKNKEVLLEYAREAMSLEIAEAQNLFNSLDHAFINACELILQCQGKTIVSGIGKSGHIGKKIAASLASTGTPAFFVHPAEALHGDLGMITSQDVFIFISNSGSAAELQIIVPALKALNVPIIAITNVAHSFLAQQANHVLHLAVNREACPMGLAPTSSAVNTLLLGDALAMALMRSRNFNEEQFARSHPGGSLGAGLLNSVAQCMRKGERIPRVNKNASVLDAMEELTRTGMGIVIACDDDNAIEGIFTDGDLRRALLAGKKLDDRLDPLLTRPGYKLAEHLSVAAATQKLYDRRISAAPVVNQQGQLVGAINLYDLHK